MLQSSDTPRPAKPKNEKAMMLLGYALLLLVSVVSYFIGYNLPNNSNVKPPTEVTTPVQETPNASTSSISTAINSVELLRTPYVSPSDPFDDIQYKNTAPKMVLSGSFLSANLYIHGTVTGVGSRFLILNVGLESGIINATRQSKNRLDIQKTSASGGIFTEANAISVSINLMHTTLGTTGTEFEKTGSGARVFSFIRPIEQVDVRPVVVVPFLENGQYGGAQIDSLVIEYECVKNARCEISPCSIGKAATQCIQDEHKDAGVKDYLRRNPQLRSK